MTMLITRKYVEEHVANRCKIIEDSEYRINCPYCSDDKFKMYCNVAKGLYHCFKCGTSGRIQDDNESSLENWRDVRIKEMTTSTVVVDTWNKYNKPKRTLPLCCPLVSSKPCGMQEYPAASFEYLRKRGITNQDMERYNIQCSLEKSGPYKNTVIFPIYENTKLAYFVARKYDDSKPKYINAPWSKEGTVFKSYTGKIGVDAVYVLCEGIFDAIAINKAGYNAIAILGKQMTGQQLSKLTSCDWKYIIYLDQDAFTHAINLKLQLNAVGNRAQVLVHDKDAAQQYIDYPSVLKEILNDAARKLTEFKSIRK